MQYFDNSNEIANFTTNTLTHKCILPSRLFVPFRALLCWSVHNMHIICSAFMRKWVQIEI